MELNTSFIDKFNSNSVTGTKMSATYTPGTPNQIYFSIDGNIETLNAHTFGDAVIETIKNKIVFPVGKFGFSGISMKDIWKNSFDPKECV